MSKALDGFVELPHQAVGVAEIVERDVSVGLDGERLFVRGDGLVVPLLIVQRHAEEAPGVGIAGVVGENLAIETLGGSRVARLLGFPALVECFFHERSRRSLSRGHRFLGFRPELGGFGYKLYGLTMALAGNDKVG